MKKYDVYIRLCKKQGLFILLGFSILLANAIVTIKIPFALNSLIDSLMNVGTIFYSNFVSNFVFFGGLFLTQQIFSYFSTLLFKKVGNEISTELSEMLYRKVYFSIKKNPAQIDVGNTVVVLDRDCFSICENGILLVYNILNIFINIIGIFYFMWVTSVYLSIGITMVFLFLMLFQNKQNKFMETVVKEGRVLSGRYTYTIQGLANNFEEYRRNKSYEYLSEKHEKTLKGLLEKRYILTKTVSKSSFINSMGSLVNTTIVFFLGSTFVLNNQLNLSNIITFNTFSSAFGGYLTQIPSLFMQIKTFNISYKRVCEMLEVECFKDTKEFLLDKSDSIYEIEIKDVSFSYDLKVNIISKLNKVFHKGNIYCISGGNGAGKTTLLNLLTGEYPVARGSFKFNGIDVNLFESKCKLDSFITYLSADSVLFNDTIMNNICVGRDYEIDKIKKLGEVLCVDEWISGLKAGYETRIDEANLNLSSGQKQKIALIRALIQNTDVLIFDEVEKHLDDNTKERLINYLEENKKDKIIIIATHDEKVISRCDDNYII